MVTWILQYVPGCPNAMVEASKETPMVLQSMVLVQSVAWISSIDSAMQAAKHNPIQLQQFSGGCRSTGTAPWHHCRLLLYSHLGKPENFSKFWKTKANQNVRLHYIQNSEAGNISQKSFWGPDGRKSRVVVLAQHLGSDFSPGKVL